MLVGAPDGTVDGIEEGSCEGVELGAEVGSFCPPTCTKNRSNKTTQPHKMKPRCLLHMRETI